VRTFEAFFEHATGRRPHRYQCAFASADPIPSVLAAPPGSGKTFALILSWLYGRRELKRGPRRLVYALPMRSLVEQTAAVARDIRRSLDIPEHELRIHVLMGGEPPTAEDDWRRFPEVDQILVGTIDMLLSRALNRGYAESRFMWPVSFGLLNSDCRWVFDEIQLMGPARVTSAQLDGLRSKLGTALPCETIWASATPDRESLVSFDRPELGEVLTLSAADRRGRLAKCLRAEKHLQRVDLTATKPAQLARDVAAAVAAAHRPGTRSIVVLNRVELAQSVALVLDRLVAGRNGPAVVLLHSRFRPPERKRQMDEALTEVGPGPGRIVVATQVIEAGVDVSSALLATETAPFSSIVQRLGRCNRYGECPTGATVLWLDRGALDTKQAAPYDPTDLLAAREALLGLVGRSASPEALDALDVPEQRETWSVLRRRHLLDLFDTSPDLSGLDVDVSRFIRPDDDRSVSVFFRAEPNSDAPRAERQELVAVPSASLGERRAWIHDPVNGLAIRVRGRAIRPGATVMLDASDGGYDERLGWLPADRAPVTPLGPVGPVPADATVADPESIASIWIALGDHLADTECTARALVAGLGTLQLPRSATEAVVAAAALHDIGKAHPTFQERLLATAGSDRRRRAKRMWAKSARRADRLPDDRPFRHELAAVVALLRLNGSLPFSDGAGDLTYYLIAAHHGKVRLVVRPAPGEVLPTEARSNARVVLGVIDGEALPAVDTPYGPLPATTLDLDILDVQPSWTTRVCALRDDPALGPFRLAFLEALVRIADWRASA
jgi:CRISPR-associated endonuclease/helicase Cas3